MDIENRNWAVVADEAKARFLFRRGRHGDLEEAFTLDNEAARARLAELVSDAPGRSFDSHGEGRHAMGQGQDRKETEAIRFADSVIDRLVREIQQGHVVRYALVAPPRFLGHLRKSLGKHSVAAPSVTVSKDLVEHAIGEIREALDRQS